MDFLAAMQAAKEGALIRPVGRELQAIRWDPKKQRFIRIIFDIHDKSRSERPMGQYDHLAEEMLKADDMFGVWETVTEATLKKESKEPRGLLDI